MSSTFFYNLREGLDGFRRAKLASLIALMTMTIALLLVGILAVVAVNLVSLVDSVRARLAFEVFVDNALDNAGIEELRQQLMKVKGVAEVQYISREQAVEIFKREFGLASDQASKSILEILETNPLPASFRLALAKPYQRSAEAQQVARQIEKLRGVDEVVYRRDLLVALDRYMQLAIVAGLSIGLVFCAGSVLLVINDVRLVIYAKRRIIEIMQLVGATRAFVRRPLLIQGFLQGAIGGMIASGILYLLHKLLMFELGTALRLPRALFVGLILAGIFLGITASYLGVRKYLE